MCRSNFREGNYKAAKESQRHVYRDTPRPDRRDRKFKFSEFDDLIKHQGEIAVQIELDEEGQARIVAVQLSDEKGFTMEETKMAFLSAAVPHIDKEEPAVQLFQDYSGQLATGVDKNKGTYIVQVASRSDHESEADRRQPESVFMAQADDHILNEERPKHTAGGRCECCRYADWVEPGFKENKTRADSVDVFQNVEMDVREVFAGKKYKPVALKVRPVYEELPEAYRIERNITGDPLAGLIPLDPNPPSSYQLVGIRKSVKRW